MTEPPRQLPSWMVTTGERVKLQKTPKEQRTARGRTKRKTAVRRSVFYCMNERELVEAAIAYLADDVTGKMEHKPQQVSVASREETRGPRRDLDLQVVTSDNQEGAYVSETDLDDEGTLPPGARREAGGQRSGEGQGQEGPEVAGRARGGPEDPSPPLSPPGDDEGLRLLREIFFT